MAALDVGDAVAGAPSLEQRGLREPAVMRTPSRAKLRPSSLARGARSIPPPASSETQAVVAVSANAISGPVVVEGAPDARGSEMSSGYASPIPSPATTAPTTTARIPATSPSTTPPSTMMIASTVQSTPIVARSGVAVGCGCMPTSDHASRLPVTATEAMMIRSAATPSGNRSRSTSMRAVERRAPPAQRAKRPHRSRGA